MERIALIGLVGIVFVLLLSGCSALIPTGELYVGSRRIDEVQQTQVMKDKPLRCMFVDCGGGHGK